MITRIYEAKALIKYISCDYKFKFSSTTCNLNQKLNNNKCQCDCKKYYTSKKCYIWNPSTCICENSRYLKDIADNSVIFFNKIVSVKDSASTNVTNIVPSNVTNTVPTNFVSTLSISIMFAAPINSNDKKVRYKMDYHIYHIFLLVTILLFMIVIICYHYKKQIGTVAI